MEMKEIISTKTENAADTPCLLRARGSSSVQAVGRGRALDGGDSVEKEKGSQRKVHVALANVFRCQGGVCLFGFWDGRSLH